MAITDIHLYHREGISETLTVNIFLDQKFKRGNQPLSQLLFVAELVRAHALRGHIIGHIG